MTVIASGASTLTPQGFKRTPTQDLAELRRDSGAWWAGERRLSDPLTPEDVAELRTVRGLRVRWPYNEGRQEAIALITALAAAGAVTLPVMGMGGISSAEDVVEFIMAGAAVVQVGTHNFVHLRAGEQLIAGLTAWMQAEGVQTLDEIRGIL